VRYSGTHAVAGGACRVQSTLPYNEDSELAEQDEAIARATELANAEHNVFLADPQPPGLAVILVNEAGDFAHRIPYGRAAFTQNGARLYANHEQLMEAIARLRATVHIPCELRTVTNFSDHIQIRAEKFARYGAVHRANLPNGDAAVAALPRGTKLAAWGDIIIAMKNIEPGIPTITSVGVQDLQYNQTARRVQEFLRRVPTCVAEVLMWAVGLWLGDGTRRTLSFSIGDAEAAHILPYLRRVGELRARTRQNNDAVQIWAVVGQNLLFGLLVALGVYEEKFISADAIEALKSLAPQLRKSFISGLIDSDGDLNTIVESDVLSVSQSLNEQTPAWSHESILTAMAVVAQSLGMETHYGERWKIYTAPISDDERRMHLYGIAQAERRIVYNNARVRVGSVQIHGALADFPIRVRHKRVRQDKLYLENGEITSSSGFFVAESCAPRCGERVTCVVVENSSGFFDDNGYWCQTVGEVPWNDPTDADAPYPFGWLRRDAVAAEVVRAALHDL